MNVVTPELGGIAIYVQSGYELTQSYEDYEGSEVMRMLEGTGIKQTHWGKLRTTITGIGLLPNAINQLDFSASHTLKCAVARAVMDVDETVTLPTARRTDIDPCAQAVLPDGTMVGTPVVVVDDIATWTTVATAIRYQVWYWPQVTVFAKFTENVDRDKAEWTWTLEAEEV